MKIDESESHKDKLMRQDYDFKNWLSIHLQEWKLKLLQISV